MSFFASPQIHYYFTIVTLLDQLDSKECNWRVMTILLGGLPLIRSNLPDLFGCTKTNIEFSRIVSKFLMDRERAGLFWVNLQAYVNLAIRLVTFLCDKRVYDPYTPILLANMNAWI